MQQTDNKFVIDICFRKTNTHGIVKTTVYKKILFIN